MGARRFEILFDAQGQVIETFATRIKGPRHSGAYVVLVEPNKVYYNLYLRLTNIKEGLGGQHQKKYGSLEVVTYKEDGLFGEYFDVRWWPKHLANYPVCHKEIKSVPWFYSPWNIKKDLEEWDKLPQKIIEIIESFERHVEYAADLDNLVSEKL